MAAWRILYLCKSVDSKFSQMQLRSSHLGKYSTPQIPWNIHNKTPKLAFRVPQSKVCT